MNDAANTETNFVDALMAMWGAGPVAAEAVAAEMPAAVAVPASPAAATVERFDGAITVRVTIDGVAWERTRRQIVIAGRRYPRWERNGSRAVRDPAFIAELETYR